MTDRLVHMICSDAIPGPLVGGDKTRFPLEQALRYLKSGAASLLDTGDIKAWAAQTEAFRLLGLRSDAEAALRGATVALGVAEQRIPTIEAVIKQTEESIKRTAKNADGERAGLTAALDMRKGTLTKAKAGPPHFKKLEVEAEKAAAEARAAYKAASAAAVKARWDTNLQGHNDKDPASKPTAAFTPKKTARK